MLASPLTPAARPRRRRLLLLLCGFGSVGLLAALTYRLVSEIPRASAWGMRIDLVALAAGEEVVVERVFAHRPPPILRQYCFVAEGEHRRATVFSLKDTWREDGTLLAQPDQVLATRTLAAREALGLDTMLAYFRRVRTEHSSAHRYYRISYFRGGTKIGEEFFVGFSLPSALTYLLQSGQVTDDSYASLATEYHIPPATLRGMTPFEMLEPLPPFPPP